jgi:hypothetical protein
VPSTVAWPSVTATPTTTLPGEHADAGTPAGQVLPIEPVIVGVPSHESIVRPVTCS